ncbi:hypothetical protein BT63DRAFT_113357 [Microthyrium microscopicum]|uniref:Rhodopsin domain-containing protein n=1 Tax=Microthyrium microscopicum TaxID=703497 RepID=A0A6A6TUW2_9PEZI|nr:hypothetical protein BT63DRAFT_113357 [Microthyrium microscopicum]
MVQILTGTSVMIADSVMIISAYTLVIIRLWFRLVYQKLSVTASDFFLLVASAELLAMMLILIKEHEMGAMEGHYKQTPEFRKLSIVTVLLYDTSLYMLKFSIISFYFKLFPAGMTTLRMLLKVTLVFTILCSLSAVFMAIFWCGFDIRVHFDVHGKCSFWDTKLFLGDWIMNMMTDLVILLLPFPLLLKLELNRRQVAGLCVTFGLGVITMIVSVFRFVTVKQHSFLPLYVWSVAEISTGIMVVSLPALRPLLRKAGHVVTAKKRHSANFLPIQPPPNDYAESIKFSKLEHRSRRGEPPDGYNYNFETASAGSSDVELHGGLKSDLGNATTSRVETIAVYTDAKDVLDRVSDEERRRKREAKDWVQQTRTGKP